MNTKLLASIAVFALLTSVVVTSIESAFAAEPTKDELKAKKDAMKAEMKAKKDAMKADTKAKKDAMKAEMKAKKDAMKADTKAKKDAMKADTKAKKDAMKADTKAKKDAMKAEMKAKVAEKKESSGTTGTSSVTVEMAKGTATNTECGDQCYVPNNVKIPVGGTVVWKNADSAAHTATDVNGSFDSSLVNAGKSFKQKFDAAGTYEYMCIVHPWMKGTVTVT
ncbi:MAG: plastocyanin/azurin family copper-binding protein [Candidatus Nitrosotenuis sp.]